MTRMNVDHRLQPTRRPDGQPVGHQRWRQLSFIHWRVPAEALQPLIPAPLEIDTYDGVAWLGLVPFYMSHIRPWWSPAVPWISNFCETNLRTYVHYRGEKPGVWFFSLDASRLLPILIARRFWKLNYYWARMKIHREQNAIQYNSRRFSKREPASVQLAATIASEPVVPTSTTFETSLEFFLAERYLLYTKSNKGLLCGQVHHHPYPLKLAKIEEMEQSLTDSIGCRMEHHPDHVLFSEGVDVEIFPLKRVDGQ